MAVKKRGKKGIYYIEFTAQNGKRIRISSGTSDKNQAAELEDSLKSKYWRIIKLGEKPKVLWQEIVIRWLTEKAHKTTIRADKIHLRWLDKHFNGLYLDQIDRSKIDSIIQLRLSEKVSNATINRLLEVLKAIFKKCVNQWELINRMPAISLLPENNERIRWITKEEASQLLSVLPHHLSLMAEFSLETGLRQANVTGLKWSQVDLDRRRLWKSYDEMKNRTALGIPLSKRAVEIIGSQKGIHEEYVFTFQDKPVTWVSGNAWRKALKRAKITDFRWHDLRHTWATWHIQRGTPVEALMKLGGWKSLTMVLRYAHLNADHLAQYVDTAELKMPVSDLSQRSE